MADPARQQFQIKRDQALGDRLIWRYPLASEEGRAALAGLPKVDSITVGYYRQLSDPPNWCFFPVSTESARRALHVQAVQRRICEDLAGRIEPA